MNKTAIFIAIILSCFNIYAANKENRNLERKKLLENKQEIIFQANLKKALSLIRDDHLTLLHDAISKLSGPGSRERFKDFQKLLDEYENFLPIFETNAKPLVLHVLQVVKNQDNCIALIRELLRKNININKFYFNDQNMLFLSLFYNKIKVANFLVSRGAKAYIPAIVVSDNLAETLLNFGASNINRVDIYGFTLLQRAVHENNKILTEKLLNAGADSNKQDKNGMTSLHYAVLNNNYFILNLLLIHNPDPNIQNDLSQSPLDCAKEAQDDGLENSHIIELLEQKGARCFTWYTGEESEDSF